MVQRIPYPSRPIKPNPDSQGRYLVEEYLAWVLDMVKYRAAEDAYWAYVESLSEAEYNEFYDLGPVCKA